MHLENNMSNEIKILVTSGTDPCTNMENKLLSRNIHCNTIPCGECIWNRNSDINSRLLELVDLLEVDDVS